MLTHDPQYSPTVCGYRCSATGTAICHDMLSTSPCGLTASICMGGPDGDHGCAGCCLDLPPPSPPPPAPPPPSPPPPLPPIPSPPPSPPPPLPPPPSPPPPSPPPPL